MNTLIALARSRARGVDHCLLSNVDVQRCGPSLRDPCWNRRMDCVKARLVAWFILAVVLSYGAGVQVTGAHMRSYKGNGRFRRDYLEAICVKVKIQLK